jgi:hypothetical protein
VRFLVQMKLFIHETGPGTAAQSELLKQPSLKAKLPVRTQLGFCTLHRLRRAQRRGGPGLG